MNYYTEGTNTLKIIKDALKEDIGLRDITTELIIPEGKFVKAVLITKEPCVVCGLGVVREVFKAQDKQIKFKPLVRDGAFIKRAKTIAHIYGKAKGILTAERVALNFLSFLSGISTKVRTYVQAIRPYKAKIMDTRKTTPGLRLLEKYAVRTAGGFNHRLSLDEMLLVKDNHLKAVGGYKKLRMKEQKLKAVGYKIELEVKNLKEFIEALKLKPDVIMLDNMNVSDIKKAIQIRKRLSPNTEHLTPKLEASGGITLKNVRKIAATGIEMISIGDLTHSINSVDISLEIL